MPVSRCAAYRRRPRRRYQTAPRRSRATIIGTHPARSARRRSRSARHHGMLRRCRRQCASPPAPAAASRSRAAYVLRRGCHRSYYTSPVNRRASLTSMPGLPVAFPTNARKARALPCTSAAFNGARSITISISSTRDSSAATILTTGCRVVCAKIRKPSRSAPASARSDAITAGIPPRP